MNNPPRPHRLPWIVGILLLAASAVGAGWALNNGNAGNPPAAGDRGASAAPPMVVAIGLADTPNGVVHLYPVQSGRVVKVVAEGAAVKKDDVLLELDARLAEYRKREADADLQAAKAQLEQAKKLPEKHEAQIKQQQAAVESAKLARSAANREYEIRKKNYDDKIVTSRLDEVLASEDMVKSLDAKIKVEDNKLAELKLYDPQVDLKKAEADVNAKKARFDQADLAVKECKVLAPQAGHVLRVQANVGEILGPNPRQSAIQFIPDGPRMVRAEVIQEWAQWVKEGQEVTIEDDTYAGAQWKGEIVRVAEGYQHKRERILEPFYVNDVRTLECLVKVTSGDAPLRIGQRVRVNIKPKN